MFEHTRGIRISCPKLRKTTHQYGGGRIAVCRDNRRFHERLLNGASVKATRLPVPSECLQSLAVGV